LSTSSRVELAGWLRLAGTEGVGLETARKLLAAFGPPEHIFSADFSALRNVVPERIARNLVADPSDQIRAVIENTLEWAAQSGNRVLTLADTEYPKSLLEIADPPLLLHVKGRLNLLSSNALAVVGSRNATAQGVLNAEKFSETLSRAGWTIVSGMALGIDSAAHRGGLLGAGSTIAVIGTGADIVYPARNRALAHQLAEEGCIVSEYPLGMPGLAANFPRRNRLISGLARGVLVVEAADQSGSLITARMAADQGRDVFAIPGSIHSPLSKGCHQLIKQGAKLVESAEDILEELGGAHTRIQITRRDRDVSPALPAEAAGLLATIGYDPVTPDQLGQRTGLDAAYLAAHLLELELQGSVELLAGGAYRRMR
jgi:DNA processing protein